MIKILFKAFVLVCVILSVYFIVNPSACSNLINGRVVNSTDTSLKQPDPISRKNELLAPTGDKEEVTQTVPTDTVTTTTTTTVTTVPVEQPEQAKPTSVPAGYTQDEVDYAIASRYVELEQEYAKKKLDTKDMAKDISYTVMDDFDLTPAEWESFLQRATATNLFERVRKEYEQAAAGN
ncbi:MAG: hypothetical protein J5601_00405 [Elusimicrobiaceae bacterium]|nr:hypothetical protein [Elusimicrobiaceae bacterium]